MDEFVNMEFVRDEFVKTVLVAKIVLELMDEELTFVKIEL
jgi:hypothetical protein